MPSILQFRVNKKDQLKVRSQPLIKQKKYLVWDNSAGNLLLGQQEEISNSLISQQDPLITNEKEDTKIYENTKQTTNDNHTNELLESMTTAREANLAELNMTLRSKEKLKEPTRFKDYVKE